ncbi:hypothetical protein MTR67_033632 [Solanum verrucosum]|uniref:Uncharacterized protein n=1 Tax=Solanum verrucosum TaxID=315347 RepID=A0AAF0ZIE4_SOLVR|nr:hypothetical protein MTR67_033632 [Solanum verrucosum]
MDGTARRYIGVHVAEATKCLQRYRTLHRKFCTMWRRMCRDTSILLDMPYDLEKEQVEEQPYEGVYGRRYMLFVAATIAFKSFHNAAIIARINADIRVKEALSAKA